MQRRLFLIGTAASCAALLSGCAGLSILEVNRLGAQVVHADVDFNELYAYAARSDAAYGDPKTIKKKYPMTVVINSPGESRVRYFLEQNDKTREQYITIHGTNNKVNLDEDLDVTVREDRQVAIPIHAGFDSAARAVYADVLPHLRAGYKTYVTGHSLGGAVAAVLAIYLIEDGVKVERVVTFGQPRFTTIEGVKKMDFLPLTRVVDENDIVPMVPPSSYVNANFGPYDHVGPDVILLEGPDFVYLPTHAADRIALGEFWRSMNVANLQDHEMRKYLKRIAAKFSGAKQVPYDEREKYVLNSEGQTAH